MNDIDWSKAPEGFPIWIEGLSGMFGTGWHRDDGDRWVDQQGSYWPKGADERGNCRIHVAPWSGDGLPPVGTLLECQYAIENFTTWHAGECVAVGRTPEGEEMCVIKAGETISCYRAGSRMRPIKTPAQIAAKERHNAIEQMVADLGMLLVGDREFTKCARLYDAGYRKGDDQ